MKWAKNMFGFNLMASTLSAGSGSHRKRYATAATAVVSAPAATGIGRCR